MLFQQQKSLFGKVFSHESGPSVEFFTCTRETVQAQVSGGRTAEELSSVLTNDRCDDPLRGPKNRLVEAYDDIFPRILH